MDGQQPSCLRTAARCRWLRVLSRRMLPVQDRLPQPHGLLLPTAAMRMRLLCRGIACFVVCVRVCFVCTFYRLLGANLDSCYLVRRSIPRLWPATLGLTETAVVMVAMPFGCSRFTTISKRGVCMYASQCPVGRGPKTSLLASDQVPPSTERDTSPALRSTLRIDYEDRRRY